MKMIIAHIANPYQRHGLGLSSPMEVDYVSWEIENALSLLHLSLNVLAMRIFSLALKYSPRNPLFLEP